MSLHPFHCLLYSDLSTGLGSDALCLLHLCSGPTTAPTTPAPSSSPATVKASLQLILNREGGLVSLHPFYCLLYSDLSTGLGVDALCLLHLCSGPTTAPSSSPATIKASPKVILNREGSWVSLQPFYCLLYSNLSFGLGIDALPQKYLV